MRTRLMFIHLLLQCIVKTVLLLIIAIHLFCTNFVSCHRYICIGKKLKQAMCDSALFMGADTYLVLGCISCV